MTQRILRVSTLLITVLCITCLAVRHGDAEPKAEVTITSPTNGSEVGKEIVVKGTAVLPPGQHLWVLAHRSDYGPFWWPQSEAKPHPVSRVFEARAVFGVAADVGWDFQVCVITVDTQGHKQIEAAWKEAMRSGDWTHPMELPEPTSPPQIVKVKKVRP